MGEPEKANSRRGEVVYTEKTLGPRGKGVLGGADAYHTEVLWGGVVGGGGVCRYVSQFENTV